MHGAHTLRERLWRHVVRLMFANRFKQNPPPPGRNGVRVYCAYTIFLHHLTPSRPSSPPPPPSQRTTTTPPPTTTTTNRPTDRPTTLCLVLWRVRSARVRAPHAFMICVRTLLNICEHAAFRGRRRTQTGARRRRTRMRSQYG